jgi:hypothetical protein
MACLKVDGLKRLTLTTRPPAQERRGPRALEAAKTPRLIQHKRG